MGNKKPIKPHLTHLLTKTRYASGTVDEEAMGEVTSDGGHGWLGNEEVGRWLIKGGLLSWAPCSWLGKGDRLGFTIMHNVELGEGRWLAHNLNNRGTKAHATQLDLLHDIGQLSVEELDN